MEQFRFWASLLAVLLVVSAQLGFPLIERRLSGQHLQRLISLAGGVAVGYVCLYLLPKVGDASAAFQGANPDLPELIGYGHYLVFLAGVLLYFLLDQPKDGGRLLPAWSHGSAFALYSTATGYVLANVPRPGYFPFVLAGIALSLHFIGICHQLRGWHVRAFDRHIRWVLAVATLAGWLLGRTDALGKEAFTILVAFLGGGILVNVLREEWPHHKPQSNAPFLLGVGFFFALSVLVRSSP